MRIEVLGEETISAQARTGTRSIACLPHCRSLWIRTG